MTVLLTADYSTGDFSRWATVQTFLYEGGTGRAYVNPAYPAAVSRLGDCGYAARHEVRQGDTPPSQPTGERSEVGEASSTTLTPLDSVRWYAFSVMFDPTFPTHHSALGWGVTNQWKSSALGSPTLKFGWEADGTETGGGPATPDGYWSMSYIPQSSPGVVLSNTRLLDIPMNAGSWIDVKMEVLWTPNDGTGYVRMWINGAQQTFLTDGQTHTGRTTIPGAGENHVHYHEGLYRQNGIAPTGIIYHRGFRIADSGTDL